MSNEITVIVGNIGTVETTNDIEEAVLWYDEYVELSTNGCGRCAGEAITLMIGDEIVREHTREGESE